MMITDERPAIEVDGLALRRGGREILRDVDLRLGEGVVALLGRNGAGKSSLLRVLAGVAEPHRGRVRIAGHDLRRAPVQARRALGYMPEATELFPYLTAADLLGTFAGVRGSTDDGIADFAGLTSLAAVDVPIGTLSAGQRRKLALVAALCGDPRVWLLDEPGNALDDAARAWLRARIARHRERGGTIVVATHRLDDLGAHVDRRLEVSGGGVREACP
jgi:ABC-2 type transport system ATP-binding protein